MNKLKIDKKATVIGALVEGNSIRSTERMTGVHRDTICRLLVRVGEGCESLMNNTMHDLACQRIQVDESRSFVGKKQRRLTAHDDPTVRGDDYGVEQAFGLYPTSGASDDYAFSRHFADPSKPKFMALRLSAVIAFSQHGQRQKKSSVKCQLV